MAHRLLLADDSLTIQKVVELTFTDSDFELLTVGNGDKAVQALADFNPDIVLADAVMPGLSGYDVCEAVKRRPHGNTVPVILLTGTFEPFDRGRAERVGCDAIVTKPFDSHGLLAQVKELVKKAQAEREAAQTMTMQAFTPEPAPSFDDLDADRPDALYATTALRIPTPEELERIAREEAELKSMAASADATPLFEVEEPAPAPFAAPGSDEAMAYETTVPLPPPGSFAAAPFAAAPFAEVAPMIEEPMPEALEVADALEEPSDNDDATLPMGGPIAAAEPWSEPAAFPEEMAAPEPAPAAEAAPVEAAAHPAFEEPAPEAVFEPAPFEPAPFEAATEPEAIEAPPAAESPVDEEMPFDQAAAVVEPEPAHAAPEPMTMSPITEEIVPPPYEAAAPFEEPQLVAEPFGASAPVESFSEAAIVVEPLVEEPPPPTTEEILLVAEAEPLVEVSSPDGIVVEPLVASEEEPFGTDDVVVERVELVQLGSGEEPEQGDIEEAIAAYERGSEPSMSALMAEPAVDDEEMGGEAPQHAEVSELEALAAGAQLDDLKRLIPGAASGAAPAALSSDQVDAIARRVVELLGERIVREVAWEIVPEMAERLVRARLQELEGA